jgi:hypothetical protein
MSRSQRNKGLRGQNEARDVLEEREYRVVETSAGRACEDLFCLDPHGWPVSVEVPHHAHTRWDASRAQARAQAKVRGARWLLVRRVPGHSHAFVVKGDGTTPVASRRNGAREVHARA